MVERAPLMQHIGPAKIETRLSAAGAGTPGTHEKQAQSGGSYSGTAMGIAGLRRKVETLEEEKKGLVQALEDMQEASEKMEASMLEEQERTMASRGEDVARLTSELAEEKRQGGAAREEGERLRRTVRELEDKVETLKRQVAKMEGELESWVRTSPGSVPTQDFTCRRCGSDNQIDGRDEPNCEVCGTLHLSEAEHEAGALRSRGQGFEEEVMALRVQVRELEGRVGEAERTMADKDEELAALVESFNDVHGQLDSVTREHASCAEMIALLRQEVQDAKDALDQDPGTPEQVAGTPEQVAGLDVESRALGSARSGIAFGNAEAVGASAELRPTQGGKIMSHGDDLGAEAPSLEEEVINEVDQERSSNDLGRAERAEVDSVNHRELQQCVEPGALRTTFAAVEDDAQQLHSLLAERTAELQSLRERLSENLEAFAAAGSYMRELEMQLYGDEKGGPSALLDKRVAFLQAEIAQLRDTVLVLRGMQRRDATVKQGEDERRGKGAEERQGEDSAAVNPHPANAHVRHFVQHDNTLLHFGNEVEAGGGANRGVPEGWRKAKDSSERSQGLDPEILASDSNETELKLKDRHLQVNSLSSSDAGQEVSSDLENEVQELRRQLAEMIVARSEDATDIAKHTAQMHEQDQVIQALQGELSEARTHPPAPASSVAEGHRGCLECEDVQAAAQTKVISNLNTRIEDLMDRLEKDTRDKAANEARTQQLLVAQTNLEASLAEKDRRIAELQRELVAAAEHKVALERSVRSLQDLLESQEEEHRNDAKEIEEALEVIELSQAKLMNYRAVVHDLETKMSQLAENLPAPVHADIFRGTGGSDGPEKPRWVSGPPSNARQSTALSDREDENTRKRAIEDDLRRFYVLHAPERVSMVAEAAEHFAHDADAINGALFAKYGTDMKSLGAEPRAHQKDAVELFEGVYSIHSPDKISRAKSIPCLSSGTELLRRSRSLPQCDTGGGSNHQQTLTPLRALPVVPAAAPAVPPRSPAVPAWNTGAESTLGLGIEFANHEDILTVKALIPGSPAALDGSISVGDQLIEVDGRPLEELDERQLMDMMKGPADSQVELVFHSPRNPQGTNSVRLQRRPMKY